MKIQFDSPDFLNVISFNHGRLGEVSMFGRKLRLECKSKNTRSK